MTLLFYPTYTMGLMLLMVTVLLVGCESPVRRNAGLENTADGLGGFVQRRSPADVYIELGTAYLQKGRMNDALLNARKAILVDAEASAAHNLLGVVYQRLGQLALAHQHYLQAVELDKHNSYALNALGQFICTEGDYSQAEAHFQQALSNPLYPTPWVAAHNAGACQERNHQLVQAEIYYRQALQDNPRFSPSLLHMAHLSFTHKRYLSARAYLQRYSEVAQHTAESLLLGIRTEKKLDDKEQIVKYQQKLDTKFPNWAQSDTLQ